MVQNPPEGYARITHEWSFAQHVRDVVLEDTPGQ